MRRAGQRASTSLRQIRHPVSVSRAPLIFARHLHPDHHSSPVTPNAKRSILLDAGEQEQHGYQQKKNNGKKSDHADGEDGSKSGFTGQGGVFDTALGIAVGTTFLGLGGVAYFAWYKWNVLRKMEIAFKGGYDPVLELEKAARAPAKYPSVTVEGKNQEEGEPEERIRRAEQDAIDRIIKGHDKGHYYLLLGPKGSGKTSMIIQAMLDIDAEGCAVCEAHEDADVFRLRFGKAINFEYSEDSYNGLFQRRDPKEAGPMLDIERAMSKLEKVAIRYRQKHGRPLVLVFNNMHFLKDDEAGQGILHLIQQRAESWAASQCANIVINSDDFRIYDLLKKNANRMLVLSVRDLPETEGIAAIRQTRRRVWGESISYEDAKAVYDLVGGRMSTIMALAKTKDMYTAATDKVEQEKQWLLSKIGLIPDHDDDVMDEEKWASCSWLLLQELVKQAETSSDPKVTWFRAREVMTRPDFIGDLDHLNIVQIDTHYNIRPDSTLLLNVMKQVVGEDDFQERLDSVMQRVNDIESLHRTRELTLKDKPDAEGVFKFMIEPSQLKKSKSSWFWTSKPSVDKEED